MDTATKVLVGVGVVGVGALALMALRQAKVNKETPAPSSPREWVEITAPKYELIPGRNYRACVKLPWFVPNFMVTSDKARAYAEAMGFANVTVQNQQPADWPKVACDRYAQAEYRAGTRELMSPNEITHAYQRA